MVDIKNNKCEDNDYGGIIFNLTQYADGVEDGYYFDKEDKKWYNEAIINLCKDFNHVKNYCESKNLTKYRDQNIQIVEGFLVLESFNGKIRSICTDSWSEIYEKYYGSS